MYMHIGYGLIVSRVYSYPIWSPVPIIGLEDVCHHNEAVTWPNDKRCYAEDEAVQSV